MKFNYFLPNSYPEFVASCKHIFAISDPGVIQFLPKTDSEIRVDQLIQDFTFPIKVTKIALTSQIVNEIEDVEPFLIARSHKKSGEDHGFFIIRSQIPILENSVSFLDKLILLQKADPTYHFVFITESDFTCQAIASQFEMQTNILSSVHYYPLYSKKDASLLIDHLCEKWKFHVDKFKKQKILEECGGHPWLLKEALRRTMVDTHMTIEDILNSETLRFRIEQIYFSMLPAEKELLKNILKNETIKQADELHSLVYFKKMRLIVNSQISIPMLTRYIKSMLPKVNVRLSNNTIMVNELILDSHFSRKEQKVLRALLKSHGQIVSRDALAKVIWPVNTETFFTEWALDRIMARLRSKLNSLGISEELIVTLRGKGYMIRND